MSKENMIRLSGFAWILAGLLIVLATLIHPSRETVQTILAQESRLITGHWLLAFYCAFFLLGLPGVYASHARRFGRIGLAGFLLLFFGTVFFAVSGDYGFNAPVLARLAPPMLDAINAYPPVAVMDGLFVLCLLVGFILFGIAVRRSPDLSPWSGFLIAAGWPLFMLGGALSQAVLEPLWSLAILGTILMGLGLAWVGYALWSGKVQPEPLSAG
jgi:hypothetical protein